MTKTKKAEMLFEGWQHEAETLQRGIEAWTDKVKADPHHAMRWGSNVFDDAGKLHVLRQVLRYVTDAQASLDVAAEAMVTNVYKEALRNALRGAQSPERSTSPTANLCAQAVTTAWAELANRLENWEAMS